ncbi:hypothetical protein JD844_012586 [Phrynosoma platyrhinos]|uniref:Uncharacterized protein n=1 Tax=Phrynosoma platyrhinos TaxID=52577 RepID=A0ABQ7TJQ9_PHRPL|nr:hypothetical protein JD844_012586 [Phrynosoma platyrhinos]
MQRSNLCSLLQQGHSTQELLERIILEHSTFSQAPASLSTGLAKLEKHLEKTDRQMEALEAKVVSTQGCVLKHSTLMKELAIGLQVADQRLESLENKVRAQNLKVTVVLFLSQTFSEKMTVALIRNRLGLLVLGVLVTFVLYLLLPAIQHERFTASIDIPKPRAMEEETKKSQNTGNITILTGRILQNPSVFFREAVSVQKDGVPSSERLAVIFLHGYGDSPRSTAVETASGRIAFLQQIFKELGLQKPVLISSSMSGHYSIPFLLTSGEQLRGFVPIAPVGTKEFTTQQYQQVKTPTLIIYGEHDTGLGTQSLQSLQQIPKSNVVMLPGAGHACYLDKPQEFHKALLNFLSELK